LGEEKTNVCLAALSKEGRKKKEKKRGESYPISTMPPNEKKREEGKRKKQVKKEEGRDLPFPRHNKRGKGKGNGACEPGMRLQERKGKKRGIDV